MGIIEILEVFKNNPQGLNTPEIEKLVGKNNIEVVRVLMNKDFIVLDRQLGMHVLSTMGKLELTRLLEEKIRNKNNDKFTEGAFIYAKKAYIVAVIAALLTAISIIKCNDNKSNNSEYKSYPRNKICRSCR